MGSNVMIIEDKIIEIVKDYPGINRVSLVVKLYQRMNGLDQSQLLEEDFSIEQLLDRMVKNNSIISIEYSTPNMDYRIKSIYFPKGSQLKIVAGESCMDAQLA